MCSCVKNQRLNSILCLDAMFRVHAVSLLFFMTYTQSDACYQYEYTLNGDCCLKCEAGTRVLKHCSSTTNTTCTPCVGSTFTEKPNGLSECRPCTVCDGALGLRPVKECNVSSDTECGPLEGYYCLDHHEGKCSAALPHKRCKPGEYIRHEGNAYSDTVCESCAASTYSDGLSASCRAHTDCEISGLIVLKPGNHSTDAECGGRIVNTVVIAVVAAVTLLILVAVILMVINKSRKKGTLYISQRKKKAREAAHGREMQELQPRQGAAGDTNQGE